MIEYSRKLNTEAKKAKISIVEKAMADLMALGGKKPMPISSPGSSNPSFLTSTTTTS